MSGRNDTPAAAKCVGHGERTNKKILKTISISLRIITIILPKGIIALLIEKNSEVMRGDELFHDINGFKTAVKSDA